MPTIVLLSVDTILHFLTKITTIGEATKPM